MSSHSDRRAQLHRQLASSDELGREIRAVEFDYRRKVTDDVRAILARTSGYLPYDKLRDTADEIVRYFLT